MNKKRNVLKTKKNNLLKNIIKLINKITTYKKLNDVRNVFRNYYLF